MNKITYLCFVLLFSINNICQSQIQRVRIDFTSPVGFFRPILLGFDPTNTATDGVDWGYDTLLFDNIPDDLNWMLEGDRYITQGVGAFDETKKYPFGLFLTNSGTITISLNALENFTTPIDVYIYDAYLDTYTQINTEDFTEEVLSGDYLDKYFIAFMEPALSSNENDLQETTIQYFSKTKELYINTYNNSIIKQISLHNLLGQELFVQNDINNSKIKVYLDFITTDISIATIITDKGVLAKKIIVN